MWCGLIFFADIVKIGSDLTSMPLRSWAFSNEWHENGTNITDNFRHGSES
jgi:hypothetical protein